MIAAGDEGTEARRAMVRKLMLDAVQAIASLRTDDVPDERDDALFELCFSTLQACLDWDRAERTRRRGPES